MEEISMVYIEMMGWLVSKTLMVLNQIELENSLLIYLGKNFKLSIAWETNLIIMNFLDLTLYLTW